MVSRRNRYGPIRKKSAAKHHQSAQSGVTERYLRSQGIDAESYLFYAKYTSLANRFAFIFTYLLQDFIYEVKKTNKSYNISKGMLRFDDSLGEYYVDCRMAWYAYYKMNFLKNRLSLHKLRIYSLNKCNQILMDVYEEEKELLETVQKKWTEYVNQVPAGKSLSKNDFRKIEDSGKLSKLVRVNLYEMEVSRKFIIDNKDRYQEMLKKAEKRRTDLRGIKNFYVDLNEKRDENY